MVSDGYSVNESLLKEYGSSLLDALNQEGLESGFLCRGNIDGRVIQQPDVVGCCSGKSGDFVEDCGIGLDCPEQVRRMGLIE